MRVDELSTDLLDYYVAKIEGHALSSEWNCASNGIFIGRGDGDLREYSPSTDWSDGGPIIERERIDCAAELDYWIAGFETTIESSGYDQSYIESISRKHEQQGPTFLIAAMRAYVTRKYGDNVPDVTPR